MAVWTETVDTYSGLEANFTPTCLFHPEVPTVMYVWDIKHLNFKMHDDKKDEPWSFATDVVLHCPYCEMEEMYGVAMSPEHHDKMWKKNEWMIFRNMVDNEWKRRPWRVVIGFFKWMKRRLIFKQPS